MSLCKKRPTSWKGDGGFRGGGTTINILSHIFLSGNMAVCGNFCNFAAITAVEVKYGKYELSKSQS